ncbi:MAG TPA: AarF/ABC1/UbiB kinase family protein [Methanomicrobia archaeon]|nr:AarF/ABC1/UbiB kinase family protein [Methanomicrobia archaeon]
MIATLFILAPSPYTLQDDYKLYGVEVSECGKTHGMYKSYKIVHDESNIMFSNIKKNVEYINRYRQIAKVMTKHGLGYFVEQMGLSELLPRFRRDELTKKKRKQSLAVTYRLVLEELGPTFIKLGQILSTRPDIISKEYVEEFSKLQDQVNPIPYEEIEKVIVQELKSPVDEVFSKIDTDAISSASIGQVHRAVLQSGEVVALKVQKPNIRRTIEIDIEIMRTLARRMSGLVAQRSPYEPEEIVDEFAKTIRKELDYMLESAHARKFYHIFEDDDEVRIPRIYTSITTRRLLAMEYIDGVNIKELLKEGYTQEQRKKVARVGAQAMLKMIFDHGFFHGDPHHSNVFVTKNDVVAFLDFGIIGRLSKRSKEHLTDLLIAIVRKDASQVTSTVVAMSETKDVDTQELKWDIDDLLERYYGKPLDEINIGNYIQDLMTVVKRYGIKVPSNYALLGKTLLMIEGIGRQLDPGFNTVEHTRPYVERMVRERMSPLSTIRDWYERLSESSKMVVDIPSKLDRVMADIAKGDFKVGIERSTMNEMTHSFEKTVNRLSFSIVIAGMVLASSMLFMANLGPELYGLPIFGWVGFMISFMLGIWLIGAIIRGGKL